MDLENIIIIIVSIIIGSILLVIAQLNARKKSKNMTLNEFKIKYSFFLIGMMFFISIFVIVFSIWLYPYIVKDSNPYIVYPIFILISLIFLIIGIIYSYNKITVIDDIISIRFFLKKEKIYKISDITTVSNALDKGSGEIKVYVGKKKIFTFSKLMTGYNLMCKKLNIMDI